MARAAGDSTGPAGCEDFGYKERMCGPSVPSHSRFRNLTTAVGLTERSERLFAQAAHMGDSVEMLDDFCGKSRVRDLKMATEPTKIS